MKTIFNWLARRILSELYEENKSLWRQIEDFYDVLSLLQKEDKEFVLCNFRRKYYNSERGKEVYERRFVGERVKGENRVRVFAKFLDEHNVPMEEIRRSCFPLSEPTENPLSLVDYRDK